MKDRTVLQETWTGTCDERTEIEVRRVGAKLRHFRGVAVGVMDDALRLWKEVWESLQDPTSGEEIMEVGEAGSERDPEMDRASILKKLQLLGMRIECARRLCEGSIGNESQEEGDHKNG
ncbi:MAG: hypothetical protein AB9866_28400 [Syntrophobacteraceae bacterium]